ncbi:glucuronate isomerase, partial [Salmonella enterica]|nr:glucuronate isomerase [Salmonella enterica]ECJ9156616.1 glucuronate isomerase [Salmonella enterica]EIO8219586.1 glucuronate isomerase [Salmonella enterica]
FSCNEMLDSDNWQEIMNHCNQLIGGEDFKPRSLITRSNVEVICTTDAPLDTLEYHRLLQQDPTFTTRVLPTFRPDDIFAERQVLATFIDRLAQVTGRDIHTFADFTAAMVERIDFFHEVGCRISDHGPVIVEYQPADALTVASLFAQKRRGGELTDGETAQLNCAMFIMLGREYKKRGWAMQIHFGALRNNNRKMCEQLGINTGFDSITDQINLAAGLNRLLDAMLQNNGLPKTILYNLNGSYNDIVATTIANFQSGEDGVKSPMQFGSGWWFNDTRRGMEKQLNSLADQGLLMHFVGMLTDSRSLVSYPRHDYFRRILCNLIGGWVERGEIPDNKRILTRMVKNICHDNAVNYFRF